MNDANLYPTETELRVAYTVIKGSQIPTVPDVMLDLNKELQQENPRTERLVSLISQDQALTGALLKTVNSNDFGLKEKVDSIAQAVVLLGLKQIQNLVASSAFLSAFQVKTQTARDIWEHSLEVATVAMRIANTVDGVDPDTAYLAALLHNSGAMLLAEKLPNYETVFASQIRFPVNVLALEERQFGTNHALISYLFAKHWQLPDEICLAICQHHQVSCKKIDDANIRALIAILKLANAITDTKHIGSEDATLEQIQYVGNAKRELMISEELFAELLQDAAADILYQE
jgi:HD-like signal output (HDOD) protein